MILTLEIKDKDVEDMLEFYISKQKILRAKIANLEKEYKDINAIIIQLKRMPQTGPHQIVPISEDELYSPRWTWVKKIAFVLKNSNKPLTANEIINSIGDYESDLLKNRKKTMSSVSGILSVKSGGVSDKKDFIKKAGESGEFEYSLHNIEINKQEYGSNIKIDDLPF
jgi:hypothetical protein